MASSAHHSRLRHATFHHKPCRQRRSNSAHRRNNAVIANSAVNRKHRRLLPCQWHLLRRNHLSNAAISVTVANADNRRKPHRCKLRK